MLTFRGAEGAFWGQVEATRRALVEFPDRAEAFGRAWERELSHNPNYPDAPGTEAFEREQAKERQEADEDDGSRALGSTQGITLME